MTTLQQMEIFYFVVTWKSFTRAALELGVSKAYVSSQISALENELKTKLLNRTTRHLSLTDAGNIFFDSCAKIVKEKKLAFSIAQSADLKPQGNLKISAPPSMCATFLADLLPKFQQRYADISLTVDSSSTVKDLLQHDIDIALRITHVPDENYIARMITTFRFVICATPKYCQRFGMLKIPQDLLLHNCLIYSADPAQNHWPFQIDNKMEVITVQGRLVSAHSTIIQQTLLAHLGIARLPEYVVAHEINNKKLLTLFSKQSMMEIPIYAIYASNITIPSKIKYFIQFLKDYFSKNK